MWLRRFLDNHVLANLVFILVLTLGTLAYLQMPRAKDPEINFNWITILTFLPGASARDVEKRLTDPLERALQRSVQDMRFVTSTSREGISNILVRFNEIDARIFDKRLTDLRREVQNTWTDELPEEAEAPMVYEITSSNGLPAATIVVSSPGDDENLRVQARNVKKDVERMKGVDRINDIGLLEPELHVAFLPERLEGLGITPADLADTVRAYFRDVSAGDMNTNTGAWLVRLVGTDADPGRLAQLPVVTARGVVELGTLARVYRATEEPTEIVRYGARPAILLPITKTADANVLELVDRLRRYIDERNALTGHTGARVELVDDQTVSTRRAIGLMQSNALIGLALVLLVAWVFLGTRISILIGIGIPFTLAGTFLALQLGGMSVNNTVLLGVVIALGMLVDDAVVVVETMYQRLQQGARGLDAAIGALREVFAPVTTSVMTTIAAFLPLMLMPGILGDYMRVIPLVVSIALTVSLLEAYWMLPAHVISARIHFDRYSRIQRLRWWFTHLVRLRYTRALLTALRYPLLSVAVVLCLFAGATAAVATGLVRFSYFEFDPSRLFYVNVEMPPGATLAETSRMLEEIERRTRTCIEPRELRAMVHYAGQMFTQTEPLFGDTVGQLMVSLNPATAGDRTVNQIGDSVRRAVAGLQGPRNVWVFEQKDGPPTARPINIKIRGDEFEDIRAAADRLVAFLKSTPGFLDVTLDYRPGGPELLLRLDADAIKRVGIDPLAVSRSVGMFVDGEQVTQFQDQGEEITVRVLAERQPGSDIGSLLRQTLALRDGRSVPLGELVDAEWGVSQYNIRHYGFRRTVTLEADLDKKLLDTVSANRIARETWAERLQREFPDVSLEFSGELDDIEESLDALPMLGLLGLGLIYAILGTQFRSYFQPLMILVTVPLAFTGVVLGLIVTGNPLSLYTMYGVVALGGIAVNAAIVLISAANDRLEAGMGLLHATVYAARRRVIPILITSLTTIAGLLSLATGLAGKSLVWGPVATAIVWGLAFSTGLTLFVIPLLYRSFMGRRKQHRRPATGS
ncbi:MAG: efflux RND transporter permease subunit [Gammaproteobacteria bacterium]|nr:efflux RND transporter permease subunit [Gammaproteobacteria bacterium]